MKLIHAQVSECQIKYDAAKRELREAAENLEADDALILDLRARLKRLFSELRELDYVMLRS